MMALYIYIRLHRTCNLMSNSQRAQYSGLKSTPSEHYYCPYASAPLLHLYLQLLVVKAVVGMLLSKSIEAEAQPR